MISPAAGLGLLVTASAINTGFGLLVKLNRRWAWENTWLAWALLALILFPFVLTQLTVANLSALYGHHTAVVFRVALLGLAWGASQIFFGLAMRTAGIAVSFATILGISAVLGGLIPLASDARALLSAAGFLLLSGVAVMLTGIGFCARAGRLRDAALSQGGPVSARGLIYCVLAGLGSGLMNVGLVAGAPLSEAALVSGVSAVWAQNATWLVFLVSGAISNIAYCLWLLRKNGSARRYREYATQSWPLALAMAGCWLGSAVLYGIAAARMGAWGPIFAWPVYMSLIVINGTMAGVLTGEWSIPSRTPIRQMTKGVLLLVVAVFLIAGSGMQP